MSSFSRHRLGRGAYHECRMAYKDGANLINWAFFRFAAFDCPDSVMRHFSFEKRFELIHNTISTQHPFIVSAHSKV